MGPQGGGLLSEHPANIDPVGDLGLRRPRGVELAGIELAGCQPCSRGKVASPGNGLPGKGGLEQAWGSRAQQLCRPHGAMHLQVVRVAVSPGWVISHEHVGTLLDADLGDAPADGEATDVGETIRILPVQAGVGVAEHHGPGHAKRLGRCREFTLAGRAQVSRVGGRGQTRVAVGRDHEDDPVTFPSRPCHRPGSQQGLVVRMSMDEDEGACEHARHCGVRSRRVRIAHISDCYAPRTGGIESQVAALAGRQAAAGRDVRVITATAGPAETPGAGRGIVDGVRVHRVVATIPFDLPIHPRTRREVGRVLDADPVDVVHVHAGVISPFAWGAVRAARERGLPVLVTVHSVWGPLAKPAFGISDTLTHWSSWGVTLSSVSDIAADQVRRAVPRSGEVLVVPNGIDPAEWVVPERIVASDRMHVVTVMRLAPRKRTLPLVRILHDVRSELSDTVDITATIVGDGPARLRAERLAQRLGVGPSIDFCGRVDREGVLSRLAAADVYLQPSVKESFGLAALEARTAGLPVVVRSQSGSTQFIHDGIEGRVVTDDASMVDALVSLGRDTESRHRIMSHNRSIPPAEAWPSVLATVDEAYATARRRVLGR